MKKLLALIMALMMMLSLAACSNVVKTNDKDDDDKSTTEQKDDNNTSEKEEEEDKEDKEDKKPSKKDDEDLEIEDVIEGKWVTSVDMAALFNMGLASAGDEIADAIAIDEFIVNMVFEFDGDEVTYYMEADDVDGVKDELKENIENADMDLELDEDQLDDIFDTMVEGLTETEEVAEYEIDGDTLVVDGEEFGDIVVKNEDKIVVELTDEAAEAFETLGFDSKLTFKRD